MWGDFFTVHVWQLSAMAGLLICSAFFSGSETAMFNLSRRQLHRLAGSGRAGGIVASLRRRPHDLLHALLLGNLLVNVAYTAIAAMLVFRLGQSLLPRWAAAAGSLAAMVVLILTGEVAPKMLALVWGPRWVLLCATPLVMFQRGLWPLLWVVRRLAVGPITRLVAPGRTQGGEISQAELAALLDLTARRGAIDRDTSAMLQEIIELTDLHTADIMVPRVDMVAYDINGPRAGLVALFKSTGLRKIPVYDDDLDHIIGVVHAKRLLLSDRTDIRGLIAPVTFMPESANVERLLAHFRRCRAQLAVVVDEYGGTAGLVTLEDVVEEIVGEMPDPRGRLLGPVVRRVGDGQYILDGNLAIHEWADVFGVDLHHGRISTIGGFVTSLLGRIPRVGDAADYHNLRFTVVSLQGRRIGQLKLQLEEGES
ncbi:MAG: hemolysin family protein [Phycisphaerae bacterium]|jgi:putative hemolysin|nr:hemolysin family protein [Phycisphaerae bacterium]